MTTAANINLEILSIYSEIITLLQVIEWTTVSYIILEQKNRFVAQTLEYYRN
jgi:hypothetical protein